MPNASAPSPPYVRAWRADDRRARERKPLLRPDDVHDALFRRDRIDVANAEFGCVSLQRGELLRRFLIRNRQTPAFRADPGGRRQIMIGNSQGEIRATYLAPSHAKAFKSLRARHFMHKVTINVDQAGGVIPPVDDMRIPNFFIERAGLAGHLARINGFFSPVKEPAPDPRSGSRHNEFPALLQAARNADVQVKTHFAWLTSLEPYLGKFSYSISAKTARMRKCERPEDEQRSRQIG